ncbi:nucleolar and coiled-body phosphoprotein 1 [Strigomonas culicis]|uniref:Nucleolar and coiled-body phosphoprotein 1 n=1 Tax=Strigomonas culicis TaxID=28005 RepID=S9TEV0_9TRYP|nr:nucleolar and coiled-body phosphoprotein 1 [Strigomonas culicis]|eukprot:EPY15469.1 nucleolar and coiled-body phosphoprotein 1 [Strigomonas culicis]
MLFGKALEGEATGSSAAFPASASQRASQLNAQSTDTAQLAAQAVAKRASLRPTAAVAEQQTADVDELRRRSVRMGDPVLPAGAPRDHLGLRSEAVAVKPLPGQNVPKRASQLPGGAVAGGEQTADVDELRRRSVRMGDLRDDLMATPDPQKPHGEATVLAPLKDHAMPKRGLFGPEATDAELAAALAIAKRTAQEMAKVTEITATMNADSTASSTRGSIHVHSRASGDQTAQQQQQRPSHDRSASPDDAESPVLSADSGSEEDYPAPPDAKAETDESSESDESDAATPVHKTKRKRAKRRTHSRDKRSAKPSASSSARGISALSASLSQPKSQSQRHRRRTPSPQTRVSHHKARHDHSRSARSATPLSVEEPFAGGPSTEKQSTTKHSHSRSGRSSGKKAKAKHTKRRTDSPTPLSAPAHDDLYWSFVTTEGQRQQQKARDLEERQQLLLMRQTARRGTTSAPPPVTLPPATFSQTFAGMGRFQSESLDVSHNNTYSSRLYPAATSASSMPPLTMRARASLQQQAPRHSFGGGGHRMSGAADSIAFRSSNARYENILPNKMMVHRSGDPIDEQLSAYYDVLHRLSHTPSNNKGF